MRAGASSPPSGESLSSLAVWIEKNMPGLESRDEKMPDASVTYRPRFVLWTSFLAQLLPQLFVAVWAGLFFGGVLGFVFPNYARPAGSSLSWTLGWIVFLAFPVVTLTVKRLNYARTRYHIYHDRLDVEEGFLTQHRKEILRISIREVNLRRGILQRLVGLGSIYIGTTATGLGPRWQASTVLGATSTFGSGVMLMDVPDPEATYKHLREWSQAA